MSGDPRLDSSAASRSIDLLHRDLIPGPFQPMGGWAHAIPGEKREAIVALLAAVANAKTAATARQPTETTCGGCGHDAQSHVQQIGCSTGWTYDGQGCAIGPDGCLCQWSHIDSPTERETRRG